MAEKKDNRENIILQQASVRQANVNKEEQKSHDIKPKAASRFANMPSFLKGKNKKENRKPVRPLSIEELYILDKVKKHATDVFVQDDNYKKGPGKVIKDIGNNVLFLKKGMEGEDRKNFSSKWDEGIKKLQDEDFKENKSEHKNVTKLNMMNNLHFNVFMGAALIVGAYVPFAIMLISSIAAAVAVMPIMAPIALGLVAITAAGCAYLGHKEAKLKKSFDASSDCAKKSAEQTLDKMLDLKKQNPSISKEELEKELCRFVEKDDLKYVDSKTKKAMKSKSVEIKKVDTKIKESKQEKTKEPEEKKKESKKEKKESKKEKTKEPEEKKNKKDGQKNITKSSKGLGVGSIQNGEKDGVANDVKKIDDVQVTTANATVAKEIKGGQKNLADTVTLGKTENIQSNSSDKVIFSKVKDIQKNLTDAVKNVDQVDFITSASVKNVKEKGANKGATR